MKKMGSGGPVRVVAFPQADAGLPDPAFFVSGPPIPAPHAAADRNPTALIPRASAGRGTRDRGLQRAG